MPADTDGVGSTSEEEAEKASYAESGLKSSSDLELYEDVGDGGLLAEVLPCAGFEEREASIL